MKCIIYGHSHMAALRLAADSAPPGYFGFVNPLQPANTPPGRGLIAPADVSPGMAEVLCLSIRGNIHNALGLIDHDIPFALGDANSGRIPADPLRRFVPRGAMKALMRERTDEFFGEAAAFIALLQARRVVVLNPPPPVADTDHILKHPGIFKDKIRNGIAPLPLRRALYDILSEVHQDIARQHGFDYLPAPSESFSEAGGLRSEYCNLDPTHGNAAYGTLVLAQIKSLIEG